MPAALDRAPRPSPAAAAPHGKRPARLLRKIHVWIGVLFTLHFLVVMTTGLLVQHRDLFGLERRTVSRRWLPAAYRPGDPDNEIRADIVITDLHSGKIFGSRGPIMVDAAVLAWFVMLATGYGIFLVSRRRNRHTAGRRC